MQPVTLKISGKFWDSQIYRGVLYLFARDGTIAAIDWNENAGFDHQVPEHLRVAAECAFRRSDYLYGSAWKLLFADDDIKQVLARKFEELAHTDFELSEQSVERFGRKQDNPFPFPHTDSVIYRRNMFIVGREGVFRTTCDKSTKYPVSTKPKRYWDAPVTSVAASYGSLALSAGNNGLWEMDLDSVNRVGSENLNKLTKSSCDSCEWMYHSIYGSSYDGDGFLAEFERNEAQRAFRSDDIDRTFQRVVPGREIFHDSGYSWGTHDKMYLLHGRRVTVARYNPFSDENQISILRTIEIDAWKGDFVSAGVAPFGAVLEYDNALVVIPSAGAVVTLPGEPINWRVFPNSKFYQNHLHVTYDDRMVVHSFNHDYFVDQGSKLFGTKAASSSVVDRNAPRR